MPTTLARRRQSWGELSSLQRTGVVVASIIQVALLATALRDLRRRPAGEVNGSRALWTLACFVNFIGPLAYLRFGRRRG